ncbi:MAG: tRNA (guanosine(37)-N1)-methyltransferase TrmD [Selenomonadaceae bacterium]|nr:tRNA (guanosine(37)-N1)-methyltransferase TrmD [Selenomonadaceae bacterium]
MRIDILSLFPEMFTGPFSESILSRARQAGLIDVHITNPRDFSADKHHKVDDIPFGGGSGMVLKPEPFFDALNAVKSVGAADKCRVILLSPKGQRFTQDKAKQLAEYEQLIFICGHYEGFDARIEAELPDEMISIGDYVLTGGELPAMVIVDAVSRMIPGVLHADDSAETDSFYNGILEYPQYTRPRDYLGREVPKVLFSGNHALIERWRKKEALKDTLRYRPDLLTEYKPETKAEKKIYDEARLELAE